MRNCSSVFYGTRFANKVIDERYGLQWRLVLRAKVEKQVYLQTSYENLYIKRYILLAKIVNSAIILYLEIKSPYWLFIIILNEKIIILYTYIPCKNFEKNIYQHINTKQALNF